MPPDGDGRGIGTRQAMGGVGFPGRGGGWGASKGGRWGDDRKDRCDQCGRRFSKFQAKHTNVDFKLDREDPTSPPKKTTICQRCYDKNRGFDTGRI
ncbi:uncharacterized protein METZ01_LOCUS343114 [marine metagenome]|uniref:Uncharacterized protein n=1 Tax=marine metagenome TaxID=408172 RepID=A0A382QZB6_9ZZZZ